MFQRSSERRTDRVKKSCVRKVASLLAQPLRRALVAGYRLKSMRFSTNGEVRKNAKIEDVNRRTSIALTVSPNSLAVNALATPPISTFMIDPTRSSTRVTSPKLRKGSATSNAAKNIVNAKRLYGGGGSPCR